MPDQWTVVSANKTSIVLRVVVNDAPTELVASGDDVDLSNEQDLKTSLRDIATRFREQQAIQQTAPLIVNSLVGYSEEF